MKDARRLKQSAIMKQTAKEKNNDDEIADGSDLSDEGGKQENDSTGASSQDSDSSSSSDEAKQEFSSTDSKLLFSGSGNFIKYWNNFVIILAMYNSLLIPLQIFYGVQGHSYIRGYAITFVDATVDLFFLIDIIIRFRTSFLDPKQSVEVNDPHKIASRYLRGPFAIDLISSVPWTSLYTAGGFFGDILDALGLLKLLRLSRLYSTV